MSFGNVTYGSATYGGEEPAVSTVVVPAPADERVPLAVRIGSRHITREVSGLSFRKEAVGGLKSINLRLARPLDRFDPDLAALSSVYIEDGRTAEIIAEGRLSDFGRSAGSDGQQWELVAFGPAQHAADVAVPLVYFDASTAEWHRSTYTSPSSQTWYDEIDEDISGCMMRPSEGSTVSTSWVADMIHRSVRRAGMELGRIRCSWDAGVTNADYVLQLVTRAGTGGGSTAASASANTAGGTLSGVVVTDFTQGDDVVSVRVVRNTSSIVATENHFFHFFSFAIRALIYSADGAARTTGYANDYILAHEVVNDLLGRPGVLDQFDGAGATVDTGGTHQFDQLSYPDGVTPEQVFDDLMLLEPAYRWTTGPNAGSGYAFRWEPWPTTVRYEVDLNDGGDFPASSQELFNKVTVRWRDRDGRSRTTTRTLACAILDGAGINRSTTIDLSDEIGSSAAAVRAGDNFLAEHNVPNNAGTITVSRPVRDRSTGLMVDPHEIEPGELIRVKGVESYPDALNASSNDGQTVFRIWSMTYSSDSASAVLELDTFSRTVANALARLGKRRTRKR